MRHLAKHFLRAREGTAAIEFSLIVMPFLIVLFGILDMALMFFVDGSLDSALHVAAREVRTGKAASANWDLAQFKAQVCAEMAFSFDCSKNLLVTTQVMDDFSSVTFPTAVNNRTLVVTESFATGQTGDYVMIQAFLPWTSWLAPLGVDTAHLSDGRYVLSASALFRNEPYEN
nr:TadE/TadG family type IV pilus assembly protein [uncultured Shinella sp.]